MNLTRLMALGTLASHGPQHGHQIRRTAEVTNVGEWGGVSVGALYRELKLMAGEGLVTELRTEQVGRRPARTVYAVTEQGRLELSMLRERAIRDLRPGPDPMSVALTFSGTGDDPEEFAGWMTARRDLLGVSLREITADRERLLAREHITPLVATVMRRTELMIESELRWHEELSQTLAQAWAGPPAALTAGADNGTVQAGGHDHRDEPAGPAADARWQAASTAPAIADPAGAARSRTAPAIADPAAAAPADTSRPAAGTPPSARQPD
jgi:DNA-binding PadR family transcriptional regulator